jgi:hypothetical protein
MGEEYQNTRSPSEPEIGRTNELTRFIISGPDHVELLLEEYAEGYVWKFNSKSLEDIEQVRLEIVGARSFDSEKDAFRVSREFVVQWPAVRNLIAGDQTRGVRFLGFMGQHLEFGNTPGTGELSWPSGDLSARRRWLLSLRVIGLSREWPIELDVRWTLGTQVLELVEYSPSADPTPVRVLPRPVRAVAGGAYPASGPIVTIPRTTVDYPQDFTESARKRVFREQVRAVDAFDGKRSSIRSEADLAAARLRFLMSIFGVYTKEACELGQHEVWAAERCESECLKLLRRAAEDIRLTDSGEISSKLQAKIESSEEWKEYRRRLREVADSQTTSPILAAGGETKTVRPSLGANLGTKDDRVRDGAQRRQAFVNPILKRKRWKPGKLATSAGVGKNSVYQYLIGTRAKISDANREAIAEALGVSPMELPD